MSSSLVRLLYISLPPFALKAQYDLWHDLEADYSENRVSAVYSDLINVRQSASVLQ